MVNTTNSSQATTGAGVSLPVILPIDLSSSCRLIHEILPTAREDGLIVTVCLEEVWAVWPGYNTSTLVISKAQNQLCGSFNVAIDDISNDIYISCSIEQPPSPSASPLPTLIRLERGPALAQPLPQAETILDVTQCNDPERSLIWNSPRNTLYFACGNQLWELKERGKQRQLKPTIGPCHESLTTASTKVHPVSGELFVRCFVLTTDPDGTYSGYYNIVKFDPSTGASEIVLKTDDAIGTFQIAVFPPQLTGLSESSGYLFLVHRWDGVFVYDLSRMNGGPVTRLPVAPPRCTDPFQLTFDKIHLRFLAECLIVNPDGTSNDGDESTLISWQLHLNKPSLTESIGGTAYFLPTSRPAACRRPNLLAVPQWPRREVYFDCWDTTLSSQHVYSIDDKDPLWPLSSTGSGNPSGQLSASSTGVTAAAFDDTQNQNHSSNSMNPTGLIFGMIGLIGLVLLAIILKRLWTTCKSRHAQYTEVGSQVASNQATQSNVESTNAISQAEMEMSPTTRTVPIEGSNAEMPTSTVSDAMDL